MEGRAKAAGDGDPFATVALPRVTAPEAIAAVLRGMILDGTLAPGTPLRESQIGASLGVSRNTLREALRMIGNERLVTHRAHYGVEVSELEGSDALDIFAARRTLELAGAVACESAPDELIDAVANADLVRRSAAENGEWTAAFDAGINFHAAIVRLNGSARLEQVFVGLMREMRLAYLRLEAFEDEGLEEDRRQHQEIVDAISARDPEAARKAVLAHLEHAESLLLDLVAGESN